MENTSEQNVNSEEIVEFEDDKVNTMEEKEVLEEEGVQAKKHVNREDRIKKSIPDETREGCKATLRIFKKEEQKWVISSFHAAHNHELATPKNTPLIRSHIKRSRVQKDFMDVLDDFGVRPKALENRYAKEWEKNFKTMDSKPVLKTLYSMEAEAP
ncbi:hypothetical protein COLO4_27392 [Corchorus olitorius]|uniref:FAR1 domain-containing protein n=1 Tax=Corchorus olitorius TaxID=93759 RepID=A0A1R3HRJ5_9ROSI|nr:hypothetical protein COLO4_27392 [Corchorus olitorius]